MGGACECNGEGEMLFPQALHDSRISGDQIFDNAKGGQTHRPTTVTKSQFHSQ